jgi:hypothetical protein
MAVCGPEGVLAHQVVAIHDLCRAARQWLDGYRVEAVIVGSQTGSKHAFAILARLGCHVEEVAERDSTLLARKRYFRDHPPRGWRKLVPLSLQVPPEPYDDYAAVILAEAYLQEARDRH